MDPLIHNEAPERENKTQGNYLRTLLISMAQINIKGWHLLADFENQKVIDHQHHVLSAI